jgi:hypothetical protein
MGTLNWRKSCGGSSDLRQVEVEDGVDFMSMAFPSDSNG